MARAQIVCDASYDELLKLTGYAGYVHLRRDNNNTTTQPYSGVLVELNNIHQGEMYAILQGLLILKDVCDPATPPLREVIVHTDSETAIREWKHTLRKEPRHKDFISVLDRIYQLSQQMGWPLSLRHVRAHAPAMGASFIERAHNKADEDANRARRAAHKHITNPLINDSPFVSVIAPSSSKNKQEAMYWEALAHHLCATGKRVRLYISNQDTKQTHPFTAAITKAAEERGVNRHEVLQQILYAPQHACDGSLARHYLQKTNSDTPLQDHSLPKCTVATRLLLGDLDHGNFLHPAHPGRLQDASKVVYNLIEDASQVDAISREIIDWTERFAQTLQIINLKQKAKISDHAKLTQLDQPKEVQNVIEQSYLVNAKETMRLILSQQLREMHESIHRETEAAQWGAFWVEVFTDNGFPKNDIFKKSMTQFIELHKQLNIDDLIKEVIRHAEKLTTPINTIQPLALPHKAPLLPEDPPPSPSRALR